VEVSLSRFEGRSRFFMWFYRIGFNEAQRRLAKRPAGGTVVSTEERPVDELVEESPGPAEKLECDELRAALAAGLAELPTAPRAPSCCATWRAVNARGRLGARPR